MKGENRVAWREGMFLRPQHFQQQDRFIDALVRSRTEFMRPFPWGLSEMKINQDIASLGKFALERMVGVMPDGTPFAAPDDFPLPEPLDISQEARNSVVFLTLTPRQVGSVEFRAKEAASETARYLIDEESASDSASDTALTQLIEVGRLNLRFGVTRTQIDGRVCIALARIRDVQNGRVVFDDGHIPSCLDIRASPRLTGMLADILGRARQRVGELALRAVEATDGGVDTFASFFLLTILSRWTPILDHLRSLPAVHPERLYECFASMAGELASLVTEDRKVATYPEYNHIDQQVCFDPVFTLLQRYLSWTPDRAAEMLAFTDRGLGRHVAEITERNLFSEGVFFLGVSADVALDQIRTRFPAVAKLGPMERMAEILKAGISGVPLRHVPTVPQQIRAIRGFVYFELDRNSPYWPDFANSSALGLHVAGDWPSLQLELWCVKRKR